LNPENGTATEPKFEINGLTMVG